MSLCRNDHLANAESVMEYIGRYTHKIAISNRRITNIDENTITFEYKDYKDEAKKKEFDARCARIYREICDAHLA
ncbi:MAG: transposase [Bacteroidetes bacterium]|nr:transposase [Bacteroidota bacterium]